MIFPSAFRRTYLANPVGSALVVQTSGTADVIQKGQFGLITCPNGLEGSFISVATTTNCKLVTGSWHTVDKIAPFYGGLQRPQYSKLIDFRRVTRFTKAVAAVAQQQISAFGWDQTSGSSTGPVFYCGTPYFLGLDFTGAPALHLLNHQLYITLPAFGGCCGTDCSSGCTSTTVDAACIMLQWSDYMNYGTYSPGIGAPAMNTQVGQVPYLNQFFTPAVYIKNGSSKTRVYSQADVDAGVAGATVYSCNTSNPSSVVASFQLAGAYADTVFGNCTFSPTDYFGVEPVFAKASLVTQDFTPCAVNTTINTSVPNMYLQLQAPVYPKGLGEQVVRDLIMTQRYKQDPFNDSIWADSLRMRETENQGWILDNVTRSAYYDIIGIGYNIYRPDNSQGLHDNDQYWEMIVVPTGTSTSAFTALFLGCLAAVGSPITQVETL